LKDETAWENVVHYLDRKETVHIAINGHDLKKLGLKPGPVYKLIMDRLYNLKLDGLVSNRDDELDEVRHWIREGDLNSAVN
jgi:tRNA nucleotidyltransferase (CCA-adding enzyme)